MEALAAFFEKFNRDATVDELSAFFVSLHPAMPKDQRDYYNAVLQNVANSEVSEEVVGETVRALQRRQNLLDLAVSAYEAAEGRKEIGAVTDLARQVGDTPPESEVEESRFVTDDLSELHSRTVKKQGLRWRLASLNKSLGSLRKGDFGFIFARPETGKTTFLASECSFMAGQADGPVLWFNNEEQGEKVMLRCYQSALGATLEQLFSSVAKNQAKYRDVTRGNLKLVDEAVLNKRTVEEICAQAKPALVVFDQIDKIVGFDADRDDLVLGAIYQWARELAKLYCPVIGVCQADGTAEGVKWLTMAHVANAKTSKQAEADWILGIGKSNDVGYEEVRHFNISKNKLIGDEDTDPKRRHDRWDVLIEPSVARYKDIIVG